MGDIILASIRDAGENVSPSRAKKLKLRHDPETIMHVQALMEAQNSEDETEEEAMNPERRKGYKGKDQKGGKASVREATSETPPTTPPPGSIPTPAQILHFIHRAATVAPVGGASGVQPRRRAADVNLVICAEADIIDLDPEDGPVPSVTGQQMLPQLVEHVAEDGDDEDEEEGEEEEVVEESDNDDDDNDDDEIMIIEQEEIEIIYLSSDSSEEDLELEIGDSWTFLEDQPTFPTPTREPITHPQPLRGLHPLDHRCIRFPRVMRRELEDEYLENIQPDGAHRLETRLLHPGETLLELAYLDRHLYRLRERIWNANIGSPNSDPLLRGQCRRRYTRICSYV